MVPIKRTQTDIHQKQAGKAVLIALLVAFIGAIFGLVFGVVLGDVKGPEASIIYLMFGVISVLLILLKVNPALATGAITAILSVYFVFHLNAGAILAYAASEKVVRIVPYIIWFFPLIIFHHFTYFGSWKRLIGLIVTLAPLPMGAYILSRLAEPTVIEGMAVITTFTISFFASVLFVGFYTRHRDEEVLRAARVEEAERTAAVLRVNEERFRLLGRATNDLVWDADLKSGRMWWNDTLLNRYGYVPSEYATNMNAWEGWVHADDRDRVIKSLHSVMENGESNWSSEYRFVCADGQTVDVVDRGLVLRDETGEPYRMIGSTTDVTEFRSLERKLRQSQKMEAVGQLTGGVAHDFNNLLTIILGNAEVLVEMHSSDPEARALAETTMQAAERGAMLTNRLLAFARRQVLAPEHLDPAKLLTGIEMLIRRTINEDIDVKINAAAGVSTIEVDPGQLENAILNLAINARDAMPDGGRLTIEASNMTLGADNLMRYQGMNPGRYVMIAVSDTGHGMPPDVVDQAFEPFFTTKQIGKGSGLGLSMVWGFVQQSNGFAQIYSEIDEGTSVRLYFPATSKQLEQGSSIRLDKGLVGGNERILLVEDDEMVRKHVVMQLKRLRYTIKEAASAAEALDIMKSGWTFDLLFTDVIMPGGMNGSELAAEAIRMRPGLKVLFTSGYSENAITHHGRLDPGVHLLTKPYRQADLAQKVREVLDTGISD